MSKTTLGPRHHKHAQRKRITDSKNGKWVPMTPILNAFVVNVGDVTEVNMVIEMHQINKEYNDFV